MAEEKGGFPNRREAFELARRSVAAGFLIGGGGAVSATVGGVAGAVLFAVGLIAIVIEGAPLYTGRIGFVASVGDFIRAHFILIFNFIGAFFAGAAFEWAATDALAPTATAASARMTAGVVPFFWRAFFCGMFMHAAVSGYRRSGSFVPIVFCVAAFVACRFEHCIADAFFFWLTSESPLKIAVFLTVAFIGNACGAQFLNATLKMGKPVEEAAKSQAADEKDAA
jgi:formate/nitrite transporter FocA (FNT family)